MAEASAALTSALDQTRSEARRGQGVRIDIAAGSYSPSGDALTFDASTTASVVYLVGNGDVVITPEASTGRRLQGTGATGDTALLTVHQGAPKVHLSGIRFEGAIDGPALWVNGGSVLVEQCKVSACEGGGIRVSGGDLTMLGGAVTGNAGGLGAGLSVSDGHVTVTGTAFTGNTAGSKGGAMHVSGGKVIVSRSQLREIVRWRRAEPCT